MLEYRKGFLGLSSLLYIEGSALPRALLPACLMTGLAAVAGSCWKDDLRRRSSDPLNEGIFIHPCELQPVSRHYEPHVIPEECERSSARVWASPGRRSRIRCGAVVQRMHHPTDSSHLLHFDAPYQTRIRSTSFCSVSCWCSGRPLATIGIRMRGPTWRP